MRFIIVACMTLFLACNNSSTPGTQAVNLDGYNLVNIDGSDAQMATRTNVDNKIIEQGIVINGVKEGLWITYHDDENRLPARIISYHHGIQTGPDLKFSNRGQVEEMSNFLNNQLNGLYGKFRFGRPTITTEYANGQFDGTHKEYFNNGKIQKLIEFKDGKQDGALRYYDEEGNITLEYVYKDGEKVSGGIVK